MTLANSFDLTLLLQTVADNIPIMLGVFDEKGRVVWINREWQRMLGGRSRRRGGLTTVGDMRVLPEDLGASAARLRPIFQRLSG